MHLLDRARRTDYVLGLGGFDSRYRPLPRSQLLVNQGENTSQNQLPALILMNDTLIRGSEEMRELTPD